MSSVQLKLIYPEAAEISGQTTLKEIASEHTSLYLTAETPKWMTENVVKYGTTIYVGGCI